MAKLPANSSKNEWQRSDDPAALNLNVENLHYHANDLDSLRRLAEVDPALARDYLEKSDRADRRMNNSMTIGMIAAGTVALALIGGATTSVIFLGWWQSIILIGMILGCSHLLRVLLTGKWSETSWFGKFFSNKPSPPNDEN